LAQDDTGSACTPRGYPALRVRRSDRRRRDDSCRGRSPTLARAGMGVGVTCFEEGLGGHFSARMGSPVGLGGSLALIGSVVVFSACGQSARIASKGGWASCTFSAQSGLKIQNFEVRGGETCLHAGKLIEGVEQGFEGGCGATCRVLRFTCHEHPGGLTHYPPGQGTGSYFAYSDVRCVRDTKHARWRLYVAVPG
jgi:hypothetical protein